MDGEVDGTQTQSEEQQGVQGEQAAGVEQSGQAEEVGGEGCRSVRARRVLLADHEGDMAALKKARPSSSGTRRQPTARRSTG